MLTVGAEALTIPLLAFLTLLFLLNLLVAVWLAEQSLIFLRGGLSGNYSGYMQWPGSRSMSKLKPHELDALRMPGAR